MKLTGTPRRFVFMPGCPAPALEGQWLGLDARGGLYILRWEPVHCEWIALGFDTRSDSPQAIWPHLVGLKGDMASLIVSHTAGPAITQGNAPVSEGTEHG